MTNSELFNFSATVNFLTSVKFPGTQAVVAPAAQAITQPGMPVTQPRTLSFTGRLAVIRDLMTRIVTSDAPA